MGAARLAHPPGRSLRRRADLGYGGTLDLLAYDETGRTVLADVKTGRSVYSETRLQLLAYGEAALIAPQGSPVA